jgi:hypothetical protein
MSNQFREYKQPDPYSFGTTARLQQQIRAEKEEFKTEELKKEAENK